MNITRQQYMQFTGSLTEAIKAQNCGYQQKYGHFGYRSIRVKLYKMRGTLDIKKLIRHTKHGEWIVGVTLHYRIRRVDPDVLHSITFHLRRPMWLPTSSEVRNLKVRKLYVSIEDLKRVRGTTIVFEPSTY